MKIRSHFLNKTAGLLGATLIRTWMSMLDYRAAFYDPAVDPVHPDYNGQKIYVFWHEYILFPIALRGHCNLAMLLSRHADAEILSHAAGHLGFDCVRGSSNRGGAAALRSLLEKSRTMNLAITPDGPRGPRRSLAIGPVFLASKLEMPLIPMGFGYDRPWRAKSWDRFAVPRPFSRARAVVGPALSIPPNLDRDGLERCRREVEGTLNMLTTEAERWAEAGGARQDERAVRRETPHAPARRDLAHALPRAPTGAASFGGGIVRRGGS